MKEKKLAALSFAFVISLILPSFQAQTGVYTLNGGTAAQTDKTYAATDTDQSAVYVLNSGNLELTDCTMTKTGDSSDVDASAQYGINAGVLADSGGKILITGGSVTTGAIGANGLFAAGSGSSITLKNSAINASGSESRGVCAALGGLVILKNVNVITTGYDSSALTAGPGGGTVSVTGGTIRASATSPASYSAGIYSKGSVSVSGATVTSKGYCAGVIEGANSITLTNTVLTGAAAGIMIWNPGAGSASVTMSGGSLATSAGDAFYIDDGASAAIKLSGPVVITAGTGNIINVLGSSTASLTADGASLSGDMTAESATADSLAVSLKNGAALEGMITYAAVTMDASSTWNVTADSTLTAISDPGGISGLSVTNITGNGHDVYYDTNLPANDYLGGLSYSLVNGGYLLPIGGSVHCTLTCSASAAPASGAAPLTVNFTGNSTTANCTGTPAYSWNFGDAAASVEQNPSHTYTADGTYSWSLKVTVEDQICEKRGRITVGDTSKCAVTCTAGAAPTSGETPLTVAFTAAATATECVGQPYYAWDFGDGGASAEQNPTHVYQTDGTYFWTLNASVDDKNCLHSGTIAAGGPQPPAVTGVLKAGNPFRLRIIGSGFVSGSEILIGGAAAPQTIFKSITYLIAKKGAALKNMLPKGTAVSIQVRNPDGTMSNEISYTRY
jgi:PKD repeat protein